MFYVCVNATPNTHKIVAIIYYPFLLFLVQQ